MAAQARVSGSSRLASSPLGVSIFSSSGIAFAPASEPYASKKTIFSVRSAFLSLPPVTAPSTLGNALRCPRAARYLTAAMRTSRSLSATAFSSRRIALGVPIAVSASRSEEHTSELQSRLHLVCRLLLEKKKKKKKTQNHNNTSHRHDR